MLACLLTLYNEINHFSANPTVVMKCEIFYISDNVILLACENENMQTLNDTYMT
jgi:hypothetical protein